MRKIVFLPLLTGLLWAVSAAAAKMDTTLEPLLKEVFLPISLECPSSPDGQLFIDYRNVEGADQIIRVSFAGGQPRIFSVEFTSKAGSKAPHRFFHSDTDKNDTLLQALKNRIDPIYRRICLGDDSHEQDYKKFMLDNVQRLSKRMIPKAFYDPSKDSND